jgi:PAS domain S-box-containing protein
LISALQAALHARKRQYEVRTLLKTVSESEAKFRTLTTSAPVGIFLTDPKGTATFFNQSWCTMAGMDAHQALGDGWLKAVHPEDRKRVFSGWQEAVSQGRAANDEFRFVRPDGTVIWVQGNAVEQQDASGRVTGYIGSCSDITERKHAEQVAEGQRTVLQLIAEDAPLPKVLEALVHSVEAQFNKRVLGTILFLEKDGLHLTHGVSPNLPAGFAKAVARVAIGPTIGSCGKAAYYKKAVYSEDIQTDPHWKAMINKPWARRLRACWSTPIFSRHGTVLGTFALFHLEPGRPQLKDIKIMESAAQTAAIAMDRKASETEIRDSERRYSELVQSLPAAVYTTDAQGRITLYNEAAVVLWGRKPEVGKDLWCGSYRLFKLDGSPLPMDQCPMAITLKEGRRIRGQEIIVERADGVRRNVVPYPDPILDDSGRVVGAVNMLLDVTEARLAEANSRQLAAIVESSQDAIAGRRRRKYCNASARVNIWNITKPSASTRTAAASRCR